MIRPRDMARRLAFDRAGATAVEFAIVVPMLTLLFAGVADFGNVLYQRFRLDSAVSAAANYAIVNASNVSSTGGATLASNAATILESSQGSAWANAAVVVNDGPSTTITGGVTSNGGTATQADGCYCPTGSATSTTWGSATTCGSACPSGGLAGKFVTIVASRTYNPLFSSYGIVQSGVISASTIVQTQ
jgi:Flp pilus assembly protein TadG